MEKDNKDDVSQWTHFNKQLFAVLKPLMSAFVIGLSTDMTSEFTFIKDSWFLIPCGAALLGNLLSGIGMEMLDKKHFTMLGYIVTALGWVIMGFADLANDYVSLIIGRAISNLGTGLLTPLVPVYIGEISEPEYRGIFLTLIHEAWTLGYSLVIFLQVFMRETFIHFIFAFLLSMLCCICIKSRESPIWLMNKGRAKEAMDEWLYLRGSKSLHEYRAMESAPLKRTLLSKQFLWPLAVSCTLFFIYRFCTFKPINFDANQLIMPLYPFWIGILWVICIDVVADIFVCSLVSKYKRRTLILISALGAICSMLQVYVYLHLKFETTAYTLSLLSYFLFMIVLQPLPFIICGELFPRNLRSIGASLSCSFSTICLCVHELLLVPKMTNRRYDLEYELCVIYGALMILGVLFLWWKLPETKDKTLLEIEQAFDKKSEETDAATIETV